MRKLFTDACLWEVLTEGQSPDIKRIWLHDQQKKDWQEVFKLFHNDHSEQEEAQLLAKGRSQFNVAAYDELVAQKVKNINDIEYLVLHGGRWWPFQLLPENYPNDKFILTRGNCYSFVATIIQRLNLTIQQAFNLWEEVQIMLDERQFKSNVLIINDLDILWQKTQIDLLLHGFLPEVHPIIDVSFQENMVNSKYVWEHIFAHVLLLQSQEKNQIKELIEESVVVEDLDETLITFPTHL